MRRTGNLSRKRSRSRKACCLRERSHTMSRAPDARPPNGNGELPARRVQNRLTTAVDSNSGHSFAQATGATTQFALAQRWKREAERLLRLFWQSGNDAALVAFCLHVRG